VSSSFFPLFVATPDVAPLTATLPLSVAVASKLFLSDVQRITPRILVGTLLVVFGTIAISLAKV
jgi:uncharacterized membrane protein